MSSGADGDLQIELGTEVTGDAGYDNQSLGMPSVEEHEQVVGDFEPVGLEELDARAALLHRVDVKYLVEWSTFSALCERLRDDHQVLEIDHRRVFGYARESS